jgi:hypothetical protein
MSTGRTLGFVGAATILLGVAACGAGHQAAAAPQDAAAAAPSEPQDPTNPLIGTWRLSGENPRTPPDGCASQLVFTQTQQTLVYSDRSGTNDVHYVASASLVYVLGNGALDVHTTYNVLDAGHVQLDTGALCTYERAG